MSKTRNNNRKLNCLYIVQGGHCAYCDSWIERDVATIDHVVPTVRGGSNSIDNMVMVCHPCNFEKKDNDPNEYLTVSQWERIRKIHTRLNVNNDTSKASIWKLGRMRCLAIGCRRSTDQVLCSTHKPKLSRLYMLNEMYKKGVDSQEFLDYLMGVLLILYRQDYPLPSKGLKAFIHYNATKAIERLKRGAH